MPTSPTKLDEAAIESALESLDGWDLDDGALAKAFDFDDFRSAFGFLTEVALLAEKRNHHPEIANVYSHVEIRLVTHDVGGISDLDVAMAEAIDQLR